MTIPARNAPRAREGPICAVAQAVPRQMRMIEMIKTSGLLSFTTSKRILGTRKRERTKIRVTVKTTLLSTQRMTAGLEASLPLRSGVRSIRGTTQRSWKRRIPTVKRPCGESISPRSIRILSTMAVLDRARRNPKKTACSPGRPRTHAPAEMSRMVPTTWRLPPQNHLPVELGDRELQADGEEEEDHADLGQQLHLSHIGDEAQPIGAHQNPRGEETHDRRLPQAAEKKHHQRRNPEDRHQIPKKGYVLHRPLPAQVRALSYTSRTPGEKNSDRYSPHSSRSCLPPIVSRCIEPVTVRAAPQNQMSFVPSANMDYDLDD